MSNANQGDSTESFISMSTKQLLTILLAGFIAGVATWGLTLLFDVYVYQAFLCGAESNAQCAMTASYALTTGSLIGAAVALFALVKMQVYRPLLVVIMTYAALWGTVLIVSDQAWYIAALAISFLYGIGLAAFAWLARIRQFLISLIVMIIVLVLVRLILNA